MRHAEATSAETENPNRPESSLPDFGAAQRNDPAESITVSRSKNDIIIAHPVRLFRDCFKQVLSEKCNYRVQDFDNIQQAARAIVPHKTALVVIGLEPGTKKEEWFKLLDPFLEVGAPIVVTGEGEDPYFITELLARGVRGYIPTSLEFDIVGHALGLVSAGGVFAPASCLMRLRSEPGFAEKNEGPMGQLTAKQLAVVEAIRRGKPNKTIAYELNMCESTVKVHVRNIMKKLQARNRTQIAFIANEMMRDGASSVTGPMET